MRKEIIGNHTLYLGDCLEVIELLKDTEIDGVVTDPPYGMSFQSGRRTVKHAKIANDGDDSLAIKVINWAREKALYSVYAFGRWENIATYPKPKSLCVWEKNIHSMGDLKHEHARKTEFIFFYKGKKHYFPNKRPTDVLVHNRTNNEFHPTQKPISLMREIIGFVGGGGGFIFDPFMGAGSTGIACKIENRKFIGCEIEEKYFEIACRRIEAEYKYNQINLF